MYLRSADRCISPSLQLYAPAARAGAISPSILVELHKSTARSEARGSGSSSVATTDTADTADTADGDWVPRNRLEQEEYDSGCTFPGELLMRMMVGAQMRSGGVSGVSGESGVSAKPGGLSEGEEPMAGKEAAPSVPAEGLFVAQCKRASRMARPAEPSAKARAGAERRIAALESELREAGYEMSEADHNVSHARTAHATTGKGPAIQASSGDAATQSALNHMSSIKSKNLPGACNQASWLLNSGSAELSYAALLSAALQTNAVNSSVTQRSKTQGAANQTSRINCKSTSQAAAAQAVSVSLATAWGRKVASEVHGLNVRNPMGTYCSNIACLWMQTPNPKRPFFAATISSKLFFNACPTKLSAESIIGCARKLAEAERECAISEVMGASTPMLDAVCDAIRAPSQTALDAVWASVVLIVYLCCHPGGRQLLRSTNLTDVDYHTAAALEAYGRAEITRRARLEWHQASKSAASALPPPQQPSLQPPQQPSLHKRQARKSKKAVQAAQEEEGAPEAVSMSDEDEEELDDLFEQADNHESRVLATKRKRGAKGCASASTSDSIGMILWWYNALKCENSAVLLSLVAHTKQAAREAAYVTLRKQTGQTPGVVENDIIRGISEENAVQSACALVPFVGRKQKDVPAVLCWKINNETFCGITRTADEAHSTALHACAMAPSKTQPLESTQIAIAWSHASMDYAPQTDAYSVFPGVTERLKEMLLYADQGKRQAFAASRMSNIAYGDCAAPKSTETSGIARSVISFAARFDISASAVRSGEQLAHEMSRLAKKQQSAGGSRNKYLVGESREADTRTEPLVTPSSFLGVGMALNEELKNWLASPVLKTRKNNFTKVLLGTATSKQMGAPAPSIIDSEPLPLLTICDVHTEVLSSVQCEDDTNATSGCKEAVVGVGLSVCGEDAMRVPEAAQLVMAQSEDIGQLPAFLNAVAVILAATSQSSYISNVGTSISASNANSAIASSKKIAVADVHRLALLSPFDCYVIGLPNIEPSHIHTPYVGTYGCPLDHGISPPGLLAHNYRSDRRQHGNMTLSEAVADELASKFAEAHFVKHRDGKTFSEAPVYTRGVPHGLIPGIHSCCDDLVEALEVLREVNGRTDSATVDVVASLPFSAWTQAIAPTIEATADLSMRLCVRDPSLLATGTGKAYLADSSDPQRAIVSPPLLDGPVQVSIADNPFNTSYEHIDSFFNAANTIVVMARTLAPTRDAAIRHLKETLDTFVLGDAGADLDNMHMLLACNVLVMLSTMYPSDWRIAKDCIHTTWALALPAAAKKAASALTREQNSSPTVDSKSSGYTLAALALDESYVASGREWWRRFCRDDSTLCAWKSGVAPLLGALNEHDGSFAVTTMMAAAMRSKLERAVRAGFLANSVDGTTPPEEPCPAHTALSAAKVKRPHVDPRFVSDNARGLEAKGCLVGLKPHQFRQVVTLAMGAHLPDVAAVQVSRNEGGLSLRVSSAADILEASGRERTSKSISPVQTEADEAAFGTRQDKLTGCALQRQAWDDNALYLAPVFTAVSEPLPKTQRLRGEFGMAAKRSREGVLMKREQLQEHDTEKDARRALEDAILNACA